MATMPERVKALETKMERVLKDNDARDEREKSFVTKEEMQVAFSTQLTKEDVKQAFREVSSNQSGQKQKWFSVNLKTILTFLGGAGGLMLMTKIFELLKEATK